MNKKSNLTMMFFVVVIIIIVTTTITNFSGKAKIYKTRVGGTQFDLLITYEKGEKALHYIDSSFDLALKDAILYSAKNGGVSNDCKSSNEYKIWSFAGECSPSSENAKEVVELEFDSALKNYFILFPRENLPELGYAYELNSDNEKTEIIGTAKTKLRIDITQDVKYSFGTADEYSVSTVEQRFEGMCTYCGENKELLKTYYPEEYENCNAGVCCLGTCPTGSSIIKAPYYAQCSFKDPACSAACGPTSVKMALEGLGSQELDLFYVWNNLDGVGEFTSMGTITKFVNSQNGYSAEWAHDLSWQTLQNLLRSNKPIITLARTTDYNSEAPIIRGRVWHIFVIVGISDNEIIIHDPYPTALPIYFRFGSYLVIRRDTLLNMIYPATDSDCNFCGGIQVIITKK